MSDNNTHAARVWIYNFVSEKICANCKFHAGHGSACRKGEGIKFNDTHSCGKMEYKHEELIKDYSVDAALSALHTGKDV